MTNFAFEAITEIPTDNPLVHAFRVKGHISDDASEELAKHMNKIFDREKKVAMLLDLSRFTGGDWDAIFDGDVISSRFRSLSHVSHYAVIGAPDRAARMIEIMDKVIPVNASAFDTSEADAAWRFVGANPIAKL